MGNLFNEFDHVNEKWMRQGAEGLVPPPESYSPGEYKFDRNGRLTVSLKNQTTMAYSFDFQNYVKMQAAISASKAQKQGIAVEMLIRSNVYSSYWQ